MVTKQFRSPRQRVDNVAAKEGIIVEHEEENHHNDSAKAAICQATKDPTIAHKCLHRIYGKRGEKVNQKFKSLQLSRKDQVSISRLKCGHHPDLKYWLNKIGRAQDTVCHEFGMEEETVEHAI